VAQSAGASVAALAVVGAVTAVAWLGHPVVRAVNGFPGDVTRTLSESPTPTPTPTPPPVQPPAMPTTCAGQRLPVPAGAPASAIVTAVDPTGEFVGGRSYYPNNVRKLVLWDNGSVHAVNVDGFDMQINAINSSGVAVGSTFVGDGTSTRAFVIHGTTATLLPGDGAAALSINDSGVIVGTVPGGGRYVPVIWRSETAEPQPLPLPPGLTQGENYIIDDDGTVAGEMKGTASAVGTIVLWQPDGTPADLAGDYPMTDQHGQPLDVNEVMLLDYRDGWITIRLRDTGLDVVWNIHTRQTRWIDGSSGNVNRYGWTLSWRDGEPVLDTDQGVLGLPHVSGVTYQAHTAAVLTGLSDDGHTIVGYLSDDSPTLVPVIWLCT
jgi:hypothetical protein